MSSKVNTIALATLFLVVATQYLSYWIIEDQERKIIGLTARVEGLETQLNSKQKEAKPSDA